MEILEILLYIIAIGIIHGWLFYSNLFVKAGRKKWEALIPFYNEIIFLKVIERPWWWIILLFLPVIGNFIAIVMVYELLHVFDYRKKRFTLYAFLSLGLFLIYINFKNDTKYLGRDNESIIKSVSSWTSAIIFAVVAATLVHTYFMQPFTIPTSSLEKSLLVGDFLFVSKFHYGARTPMTPIAAPMVHDTIPLFKIKSYLKKPQLPYFRFPGFQSIKRNDIVVFNWPADTVTQFFKTPDYKVRKPIDKKSNYVKRCVAIAGDTLSIINGYVYINGKQTVLPDRAKPQFNYTVYTDGQQLSKRFIENRYGSSEYGQYQNGNYRINLTAENARRIVKNPLIKKIERESSPKGVQEDVFPHDAKLDWNKDYFGPMYIPEMGKTVAITIDNLPLYNKIIGEYEKNDLKIKGRTIYINGKIATSYTFKQNYYWMMGDNRDHSEDSRYWGFVPFDHVVGKPVFIWMSWNTNGKGLGKIRWERLFTTVGGSGKPVSYFYYFLAVLALWFGYDFYRKRKKAA